MGYALSWRGPWVEVTPETETDKTGRSLLHLARVILGGVGTLALLITLIAWVCSGVFGGDVEDAPSDLDGAEC